MYIFIITGFLCGECKDGKGVSALLNYCVTCEDASGILVIALGKEPQQHTMPCRTWIYLLHGIQQ